VIRREARETLEIRSGADQIAELPPGMQPGAREQERRPRRVPRSSRELIGEGDDLRPVAPHGSVDLTQIRERCLVRRIPIERLSDELRGHLVVLVPHGPASAEPKGHAGPLPLVLDSGKDLSLKGEDLFGPVRLREQVFE
jgi:hypothetical protein